MGTKMKRIILFLSAIIFSGIIFNGCKKGKDDPFISLYSRNHRLMHKWKLIKIARTDVSNFSQQQTTTVTFDGTTYTSTSSLGGSVSATGTYEMTIDKQGAVSWSSTYTQTAPTSGTADIRTGTSTWEWLGDNKNKDQLIISGGGSLFSGGQYYIDELKNKELILKRNSTSTVTGSTTITNSNDDTYTFTKE